MPSRPRLILRMGSHAEKEYIEKTSQFLDGLIIGANLIEATPGATASLLSRLAGAKEDLPYYIDPMTYAYGLYMDPQTGKLRHDIDWIKSDQQKGKKTVRDFKKSYRALAEVYGPPFSGALERKTAVTWEDLSSAEAIEAACSNVAWYQLGRIRAEFEGDPEFKSYADTIPKPAAVLAPYFYIDPENADRWLPLNISLSRATAKIRLPRPVHAVICADYTYLGNQSFLDRIRAELPETGVKGVWLWFSRFQEDVADLSYLRAFRLLVQDLSKKLEVYNLHGGFFSLALTKLGMTGVSHGVGYGEQKDVVPVVGQSTPMVRYYLPSLHKKLAVPQIERCFEALKVKSPADFHKTVCDCVVCKGVVGDSLRGFHQFGELHRSTPASKRDSQTPAAAKRCRYHFLLTRIREREWLAKTDLSKVIERLKSAADRWSGLAPVASDGKHLLRWTDALV